MDLLPQDNTGYGKKEYWDERYAREEPSSSFDWFRTFSDVSDDIHRLIPNKQAKIVMLGCGNSTLSQDMYDDGYENIVNVDYSRVCIERMSSIHSGPRPRMAWLEGDVRDMPMFEDSSVDVALDKGTMDAMMTSKGDVWNPPQEDVDNCNAEVTEALRILKPGGLFIYITFGQPHFRKRYMTRPGTTLTVKELHTAGFSYFLYVLRKDG